MSIEDGPAIKILPVLDVKDGHAVHARGGLRAHYRPIRSILHDSSDPVGLALAFRDRLGLEEFYLADLDAIEGRPPAIDLLRSLATLGLSAWVDAGAREARDVAPLLSSGADMAVLGLETVRGPVEIRRAVERFGADRLAFSLDLRDGRPLVPTTEWGTTDPVRIAADAVTSGIERMIVLDLARVGTGSGAGTARLLGELRTRFPRLELVAGGGVSGPDDLRSLRDAGASAVLVGSALHDGRIGASG